MAVNVSVIGGNRQVQATLANRTLDYFGEAMAFMGLASRNGSRHHRSEHIPSLLLPFLMSSDLFDGWQAKMLACNGARMALAFRKKTGALIEFNACEFRILHARLAGQYIAAAPVRGTAIMNAPTVSLARIFVRHVASLT
jgi:hypothetical protein